MYLRIPAVMAANHGLITTAQLRDCGIDSSTIAHRWRTGALIRVRRGVYADPELWHALDDRGQERLRTRAATLRMGRGFAASHDSAAHEHRLEILIPPEPWVHITRPGVTNAWSEHGVKHHLARFSADQVVVIDELPVLDLPRTAVDIARELGEPYGEIACDAAMRRGVGRRALEDAASIMTNWPHKRRVDRAVAFADPRAETLAETLGRLFVGELGLRVDDLQFPVVVGEGDRMRWCDLLVGPHAFEVDGRIKYRAPADGGVADVPPHQVVWEEKRRDRELAREGLGASHLVFSDFFPPHRPAALRRARAEYDESVARFGPRTPERLVQQAQEIRSRGGRSGAAS